MISPGRLLAASALLVLLVPAGASASNGITPVSPKSGAKIHAGTPPTFKVRSVGSGPVWVHVCKSKKKDKDGVICSTESIGQAKKKGGVYSYKPKKYTYPGFWAVTPGTYYWQAFRIACDAGGSDCDQEGQIAKFTIV
jgi:hypothetical protein